jgi:hypothetical protein
MNEKGKPQFGTLEYDGLEMEGTCTGLVFDTRCAHFAIALSAFGPQVQTDDYLLQIMSSQ